MIVMRRGVGRATEHRPNVFENSHFHDSVPALSHARCTSFRDSERAIFKVPNFATISTLAANPNAKESHEDVLTVIMSSNVGLTTPRGSGTSGYVQRNLSHLRPRDNAQPYPKDFDSIRHRQRQPDKEILEHDRKRRIEVKVFELKDKLEDEGYV